jgi:hypothetical protein
MRSFEQLVDLFLGCVQMLSRIMLDFINVRRALHSRFDINFLTFSFEDRVQDIFKADICSRILIRHRR